MSYSAPSSRSQAVALLIAVFFLVFAMVSVVNHERFLTFGWDLGFYDQMAWQFSRLRFPYSTFVSAPALGVRFSPILAIVAPLYRMFPDAKALLVVQALLAAGAAYPIFLLGKRITGSAYTGIVAFIAFLSFIGLQRAVFFDFHPDALLPFFAAWSLLFAHSGRTRLSLLFSFLMLLCKEWVGLLVAAMGLMFILQRQKRLGFLTFLLGIAGFLAVVYLVLPGFGSSGATIFSFGAFGNSPHEALASMLTHPLSAIRAVIEPPKLRTMFGSLFPFAFLPLVSPATLLPIVLQFAVRFFDVSHQQSWTLLYHYSAPLTPFLAYGAIIGIRNIRARWATHLLLASSLLGLFMFHAPVFTVFKPAFYFEQPWIADTRAVISRVPPDVPVAAQNNLVPHLSARERIYPLPMIDDAQFIAVDFHPDQSEYNFSTASMQEIERQIEELISSGGFVVDYEQGDAMLLRRNSFLPDQ